MPKVAPSFSHRFCVDLAGGQVYRQAEKLYESGAVQSAAWEPPYLAGKVKGAAGLYEPRLNLRSTVFVENECRCPVGRKGRICAHAIAMCLHYEANRSEAGVVFEESSSRGVVQQRVPAKPNLRRRAEASVQGHWSNSPRDYPEAMPAGDPMSDYPDSKIVVDGSTQYLAIRLPSGGDDSIRPLREILKTEGFQLEPKNRRWWLRDPHKVLNFLANYWNSLRDQWRVCFTDNFEKRLKGVRMAGLEVEAHEEEGGFRLDLSLSRQQDPEAMRRAMAAGKHYFEGNKGKITLIDRRAVAHLHRIEKAVSGQADRPFTAGFSKKLAPAELVAVEELLDEMAPGWEAPQAWQLRSRALREIGALDSPPIPKDFDQRLRTYQRIGVAWLWHLYRHQLGGILADEMGLGKTLQALALITCVKNSTTKEEPALVVCPASLVENWCREAARFTPNLRVLKHHGPARAKEAVILEDADLVITSYGTLRQDGELMGILDWSVIIGDEAQHIKNRRSQNARTLTRLHSGGRFLLTGTPVENSLDDLFSLFEFLMPGYLNPADGKLTSEDRAWHSEGQSRRAAAYILRRTKQEVAPELPEKIEKTFYCELGNKQQRFYQETLEKTRREIFQMEMAGANAGRLRFAAFKELLRLRQVCVDPRILDSEIASEESAKLAAFDEVLAECLDNGGRMLVFSSFVTALKLLAQHLESAGHRFSYLDGQTRNRLAVCDAFNNDPGIPVFLISLKAGGTGLNLTGADTVLHYDPWWNPAAEAQATDRAHRIGQERVVTSVKLIAANTVEEKVLELQKRKAELLAELFEESAAANAKVSIEDLKDLLS
jgi:superfamily II DNA or RNA helicase